MARPTEPKASGPSHTQLMLHVAQSYYEQGRTQEDIGRELHLTRWKVGRLLDEAREVGIVQIKIVHPQARRTHLEVRMRGEFGLRECIVVPGPERPGSDDHIAAAAAGYLKANAQSIATLAVSWGNTLQHVAAVLPAGWTSNIEVIQANGGVSRSVRPTTAANIATSIAHSGNGRATLLPVPAIVERIETRDALYAEGFVVDVLNGARQADALLFSLGASGPTSVLVESGAVTPAELRELDAAGACGDVLAHFLTADGQIAHPGIDSRTVGLGLDDVRNANCAIAVAAGPAKVPMVGAALRSGLCSVLITDEPTATAVLEQTAKAGGMA
ncbi:MULTISPECIES: sugar-binding transcriptional regulator [Mycobacteriaceae]|uniref:sugar-binding transcriptional regulator n=1 Tax=Mycobacteriaceae TaxID=1762 RepID=UPI0002E0AB2C|nr:MULTISPECIES: sugar-binding transcriptional regulator [Mycobacteriaceae]AMO05677.1 transcriptional regulator [Mycolicibacterium neoaurum]AXK75999.1 sugar-binding transcriptional regulator [Mycolicibacterium neoaurum]KUM09112.1 transcriptional regulator [Mycolicibacterium neoaurum]MDO3402263.1 sugar-binding transcriptional regulator [Mycolicibacterium neoaurum]WBP96698.1 sugar-binding transcriptional regulator [Mycolicibacterium neoaurum]